MSRVGPRGSRMFGLRMANRHSQTLLGLALDTSAQAYAHVLVGTRRLARSPGGCPGADGRARAFSRQVAAELERRGWRLDYASRDFVNLFGEDACGATYVVQCHTGAGLVEASDVLAVLEDCEHAKRDRALVVTDGAFSHSARDCARWGAVELAVFAGGVWTYRRR